MSDRRAYAPWEPRAVARPHPPATVRLADEADAVAAAALALTVAEGSLDEWQQRLTRDVVLADRWLFVSHVQTDVVGYCRLNLVASDTPAPDGYYLVGLVVAEQHRRGGVGAALMQLAIQQARQVTDQLWSFYGEANRASAALHGRLGFVEQLRGCIGFPGQPPDSCDVLVRRSLGETLQSSQP